MCATRWRAPDGSRAKALTHETKEHIARLTSADGGAQSSLDDLGPLGKMDGGVRVSYVV